MSNTKTLKIRKIIKTLTLILTSLFPITHFAVMVELLLQNKTLEELIVFLVCFGIFLVLVAGFFFGAYTSLFIVQIVKSIAEIKTKENTNLRNFFIADIIINVIFLCLCIIELILGFTDVLIYEKFLKAVVVLLLHGMPIVNIGSIIINTICFIKQKITK